MTGTILQACNITKARKIINILCAIIFIFCVFESMFKTFPRGLSLQTRHLSNVLLLMFTLWSNWGFINKLVFTIFNTSGFTSHVQGSQLIEPPIIPVGWKGRILIYKLVFEPGKFQIPLRNLFGIPPSILLVLVIATGTQNSYYTWGILLILQKEEPGRESQHTCSEYKGTKQIVQAWPELTFSQSASQMLPIPKCLRFFICLSLWNSPSRIPYLERPAPSFGSQTQVLYLLILSSH